MWKNNIFLLVGGLLLLGSVIWFGLNQDDSNEPSVDVVQENTGPYELVQVWHNGRSTIPEQIVLQAGKNYDIQITPERNGLGCMFEATVPTLSREAYQIKAWETFSIKVTQAKPGKYPIVCSAMGMKQGDIIVQG